MMVAEPAASAAAPTDPVRPRLWVLVVTWKPDAVLLESLLSACSPWPVLIVDNGSGAEYSDGIRSLCQRFPAECLLLETNLGIAAAQAQGLQWLASRDCSHVLFLDQDSVPQAGMLANMLSTLQSREAAGESVAVGPLLYDPRDQQYHRLHAMRWGMWWRQHPLHTKGEQVTVAALNASGMMTSLSTMGRVGPPDASLFIDHVDTEWSFRAVSKGVRLLVDRRCTLEHRMGDSTYPLIPGLAYSMPYRSPNRHYYLFRNSRMLWRRAYVPLTWKCWNALKLCYTWLYFGFFSRESQAHRAAMCKGFKDGAHAS
ncbi:MAG: glycosyltransferase family 2 protein [Gammaproteobacteria bacterium]|nr:MAG: glycosyltransferase family 2 protein [Gammaproteobacteria bacterium]